MAKWRIVLALKVLLVPTIGMLAFAGASIPAGAASQASASAYAPATETCYTNANKARCDKTDPESTGCAKDAYTVSSSTLWFHNTRGDKTVAADATVELRYSPRCQTNWSKVTVHSGAANLVTVKVCRGDGSTDCTDEYSAYSSYAYSDQLYAPNVTAVAYGSCCGGNGSGGASGSARG
ncbi:hypothetical protein GCM10029978_051310 [Actinoallomurus acanthiterrae]